MVGEEPVMVMTKKVVIAEEPMRVLAEEVGVVEEPMVVMELVGVEGELPMVEMMEPRMVKPMADVKSPPTVMAEAEADVASCFPRPGGRGYG